MSDGDEPRLQRSSLLAGVAEGVLATALPLLVANVTRDPLAVAGVIAAQHLPWIAVAVLWQRLAASDRRTVVGVVHTARAVAAGYLGVQAAAGTETVLKIQLVALLVGLGEALAGAVEEERDDTAHLSARGMIGVGLVGMPLGGLLYELFTAVPFVADVLFFALAALFALFVQRPVHGVAVSDEGGPDGRRRRGPPGALLATGVLASLGSAAVLGVLVLFALDGLGLGAPAFGLLLAGMAGAAAAGAWVAPEVGRAIGLRSGVAVAGVVAAAALVTASQVADAGRPWASVVALGIGWAAAGTGTVLLRAVVPAATDEPEAMRDLHLAESVAVVIGALAGGWLARAHGVDGALLLAAASFAASALAVAAIRSRKSLDGI